jgi:outer membrane protein assembly factor BamB
MKNTLKLVTILVALSATAVAAADWPWLYGPRRDHTSDQRGLLRTWPQEGPKVLWTVPMGVGFGGPAVSGGNVYLLDRDEKVGDTLRVLDLASGKELWTFAYDAAGGFIGAHTQPPVLHDGHFYSHYTINERSDGLVAMSMDGQIKWKTDQQPPFVRGGSVVADGLLLMTDGNTKLYLVEPSPAGFKPLASAVILEPGDNWAPLALVDGMLLVRGQKELKALQVAR